MKHHTSKRKIAETVVGAAVGAAIAGPAGAVAGGLVGSQVSGHNVRPDDPPTDAAADPAAHDPLIHANLRRILVPIDFSEPSRRALRFARTWAERYGSEVIILYVAEPLNALAAYGVAPIAPPLPQDEFYRPIRAELEKLVAQEFPDASRVSVHLREGVAFDEISTVARELDVDLIIVATHGRTGLSHALLGSTAERVVRHAPCPVLTLRRGR